MRGPDDCQMQFALALALPLGDRLSRAAGLGLIVSGAIVLARAT
jgi:hypothetical protein